MAEIAWEESKMLCEALNTVFTLNPFSFLAEEAF